MRKKYFRMSPMSILLQAVSIAFTCSGLGAFIFFLSTPNDNLSAKELATKIFILIVFGCGSLLFAYVEAEFLIGNINLDKNRIFIKYDISFGPRKIQYPVSINYLDICDIFVIPLRRNSKGKPIAVSRPIPFLVITNNKNRKFRFDLSFISNRTVKALLNDLLTATKRTTGFIFDVDKLFEDFKKAKWATKE